MPVEVSALVVPFNFHLQARFNGFKIRLNHGKMWENAAAASSQYKHEHEHTHAMRDGRRRRAIKMSVCKETSSEKKKKNSDHPAV